MKWITASDLERWAHTLSARSEFPALIGDLIRASAPNITAFRFLSGDKGQVRGFDGYLEAGAAPPFVPEGRSIWEFGITKADVSKANSDFASRTESVSPSDREDTTFVFASPHTWDNPKKKLADWISSKNALQQWKHVQYIDGAQIESWLAQCPAVAARYARCELRLTPQLGARSTDEYWDEYAARFKPQLNEDVLLCDREKERSAALETMMAGPTVDTISADSPDEVIAFAISAIRRAPPEVRLFLESRTLIIDSEEAARLLANRRNLVFLVRSTTAARVAGLLGQQCPTLVGIGRDQPTRNYKLLPRPSTLSMTKALASMGFSDDEAFQLARTCGRSVTILARRIPSGPGEKPAWVSSGDKLIPALLAGGWDSQSKKDQDVLKELSGEQSYTEVEATLQQLARQQDAPIDREQTIWKMRAPVDAFVHLGHLITAAHLESFRSVATKVFSFVEKPTDPNEVFGSHRGDSGGYSSWLREGLATTLLQVAVLQDQADLVIPGQSGQQFVDDIVRSLPGLCTDYRLMASLRSELPLLAEAAPSPLLVALEQMLEGDGTAIRPIFNEIDGIISPISYHTGLLWALETLAWDPTLLMRTALVLAKLANIDPGGKLGNRPINSLRAIFLSWSPNTNAPLNLRLSVLDIIVKRFPDLGWQLLLMLLPRAHDSSMPAVKPRYREAGGSERETLTYGLVWESQRRLTLKSLALAEKDARKLASLITVFANFEPDLRIRTIDLFDNFLDVCNESDSDVIWSTLRDEISRNRAFSDANWALPTAELDKLESVIEKHNPSNQIIRSAWLFNNWQPRISNNAQDNNEQVDKARKKAVIDVIAQRGAEGVLTLAHRVKLPQFVATAAVSAVDDASLLESIIVSSIGKGDRLTDFLSVLSAMAYQKFGPSWADSLRDLIHRHALDPIVSADLLANWPDTRSTWKAIEEFGEDISLEYWRTKPPAAFLMDTGEIQEGVFRYLQVGRPIAALSAIDLVIAQAPTQIILDLLDAGIRQISDSPEVITGMLSYNIQHALEILEKRPDVSIVDIAKREYAYLPFLHHQERALSLHKLLVDSAEFYVSVLCDVYRRANSASTDSPDETSRARARAGYQLLNSLRLVPGQTDRGFDASHLRDWINEVRRRSSDADRAQIADQCIGHVLAHSAVDSTDGAWPHRVIRDVIEEVASEDIEKGIAIERYNMRGVYSKALYEGGEQERVLAAQAASWARTAAAWPRTALMLQHIARVWTDEAERADEQARQDLLRD